jgi:hypothetical protein
MYESNTRLSDFSREYPATYLRSTDLGIVLIMSDRTGSAM